VVVHTSLEDSVGLVGLVVEAQVQVQSCTTMVIIKKQIWSVVKTEHLERVEAVEAVHPLQVLVLEIMSEIQ
jgi:hypothetical protein